MALVDVSKGDIPLFTLFQQNIENQFEKLLCAFYGSDYKKVLARGKLAGNNEVIGVIYTIREIESKLGITIIKPESK